MAVDVTRQGTKGGDPQYDTSNLRGVREERGIVTGVVKANVHGAHMGVIRVWIPTFSTDPEDKAQWRTVRYCTPFYSRVESQSPDDNSFLNTKVPSGIVTPPPDLGTKVLCFFPEGRNAEGYYFACIPDTFIMQNIPEVTLNSDNEPAGEINDKSTDHQSKKITNFKSQKRAIDPFAKVYLTAQGLQDDPVRGISNSGYMRESPSELIGFSSKGRRITSDGKDFLRTYNAELKSKNTTDPAVVQGLLSPAARRKGHSVTLDDGDIDGNSNQIRLRTSTGHQLLLNDSEGVIYIGNATGSTWIELNNTGTVDVFAEDSINFRTKNMNFHADENIKFHSKGYTQIVSEEQLALQGKGVTVSSGADYSVSSSGKMNVLSGGGMKITSGGSAHFSSGGIMSIAGTLVLLQGPKSPAKQVKPIAQQQKLDVEFDETTKTFTPSKGTVTTTDRVVSHGPFPYRGTKNETTSFTGGTAGGGGGLGAFFAIVSAAVQFAGKFPQTPELGMSPGAMGGKIPSSGFVTDGAGGIVTNATTGAPILSGTSLSTNIPAVTKNFSLPDSVTSSFSEIGTGISDTFSEIGAGISDTFSEIGSKISEIDLPGIDIGSSTSQLAGTSSSFSGADLTKFVQDAGGKIVSVANQVKTDFGEFAATTGIDVTQYLPAPASKLTDILSSPTANKLVTTDIVKQNSTGFGIGVLDDIDIQSANAAVVKTVGSNNISTYIDAGTKAVGKYGFNVNQLQQAGLVRPEASFNDHLSQASMWTGKAGGTSLSAFLNNPTLQETTQQAIYANEYQAMVNSGAIQPTDGAQEVMAMLVASNTSSPDLAALVRSGGTVEGLLPNITNINSVDQATGEIEQAMRLGANASKNAQRMKDVTLSSQISEEEGLPGYAPGTTRDKDGNLIFKS